MKHRLTSLRFRMLLPVIVMTLIVVILLTMLFSRAYIGMILQQEQEVNAGSFDTISRSITPLINNSISAVRSVMMDERVASYARFDYVSTAEVLHERKSCRDYLRSEVTRYDGIYGLLFMRKDGSMFGVLPEGNFFYDKPEENPLPEDMINQILNTPLGQTVWVGPLSASAIYGFESSSTQKSIMIAAWKSVDVSYGECYAMMLMDESIFDGLFSTLQDGKSTWHLFTADHAEIYHTGKDACQNPELLISESNSGTILYDEDDRPFCTFSMTMTSPNWTLLREVSMENYEEVVHTVRRYVMIIAAVVFLIALIIYELWLKRFMRQFRSLLNGIVRMGQGDLESATFEPTSIDEFKQMQQEINRTRLALNDQMDTIRRMERERMEHENKLKEQERILEELKTARNIQMSALPHIFPPFPERSEFDLYAVMDPALDVGGDFYDFFFIDNDHLCLVIADVSGKGIPGALFMMISKRVIEDSARLEFDAGKILQKANETLCDNNQAEMFVTVWLGILEISTGKLNAANAGHEYPVIRKGDGCFELHKDPHGFVLGGMENLRFKSYELTMAPGDKLFVYTDGVPEATARSGEMYGTERMVSTLNTCADDSPEAILQNVKNAVDAFVGDAEQFDDLTMMCLEYRGLKAEGIDVGGE